MTRKVTISSDNITPKQWSVLLLELNLMKQSWERFAKLKIEAPEFKKVTNWGTRRYDQKEEE
jgi:hypothetical protein